MLKSAGAARRASVLDAWAEKSKEDEDAEEKPPGLQAWADWSEARQRSESATLAWEMRRAEKAAKKVTEMFPKKKHDAAAAVAAAAAVGKGKAGKAAGAKAAASMKKGGKPEKISAKEKTKRLKALEAARARLAKYDERAAQLEAEPPVDSTDRALLACYSRQGQQLSAVQPSGHMSFDDPTEELRWEAGLVPRADVRPPGQSASLRAVGAKRRDLLASHVRRLRRRYEEDGTPEQEEKKDESIGSARREGSETEDVEGQPAAADGGSDDQGKQSLPTSSGSAGGQDADGAAAHSLRP